MESVIFVSDSNFPTCKNLNVLNLTVLPLQYQVAGMKHDDACLFRNHFCMIEVILSEIM
jgi:hypothetical protein